MQCVQTASTRLSYVTDPIRKDQARYIRKTRVAISSHDPMIPYDTRAQEPITPYRD